MCGYSMSRNPVTDVLGQEVQRQTSVLDEVELGYRATTCLHYENEFDLDNWLEVLRNWVS